MEKYGITMSGNPTFNGPVTFNIYNDSKSTAETGFDDVVTEYRPVKKSEAAEYNAHRGDMRYYQIKSKSKGSVLVVNNEFFANESERQGSKNDLLHMFVLWTNMDCDVTTKNNLTAKELLEAVKRFSDTEGEFDFYVVIIMSHGKKDDLVVGTEGGALEVEGIVETIANSDKFKGKPKLIFFQMCRGPEVETKTGKWSRPEVETRTDSGGFPTEDSDQNWIKKLLKDLLHGGRTKRYDGNEIDAKDDFHIRGMKDVLLAFSTQPNCVSIRNIYHGSWFIQSIYNVFTKYAATHDVAKLMELVKDELDEKFEPQMKIRGEEYLNVKETLDFDHTFGHRKLCLFPGFPQPYKEE